MEPRERVHLHEHCVVPFRRTGTGVEFCLVTPRSENRWEFPKLAVGDDAPHAARLNEAAASAGLKGRIESEQPLGEFESSRGNETRTVTAFLMQVDSVDEKFQHEPQHRRLWCLPEEGRARIRRKPMRRFIDMALTAIETCCQPTDKRSEPHNR